MKKIIATTLFGLVSALSAEPTCELMPTDLAKPAFFYVRFSAAEVTSPLPGLGIGYRRMAGNGAADISISGIGYDERKGGSSFVWTAPKASYLYYLKPEQKQSFYLGTGLAWGGVGSKHNRFVGLIPSFTSGYEFIRKSSVLGFTEINISQPALAVYQKGKFPTPIAECTVGIGF